MSSDSQSVFTIGDVVLSNPKEAASLLTIVIFFAVCAQYLFIALRKSKIAAVRMVFNSFSNSLLTIGAISLVFSFASQAVGGVNERWLLLLRWSQVVLLTLLLQLFVGTIIGTAILRKIWSLFDKTEGKIPSSTYAQATASTSSTETSFFDKYTLILHIVFVKDVAFMVQSLAAAAAAAAEGRRRLSARRDALRRKLGAMLVAARERDEMELQNTGVRLPDGTLKSEQAATAGENGANNADLEATLLNGQSNKQSTTPLLLSSILQNALHTQMSDLADITWLSWLMLVFLVAANSVRMFALPGKLQSKPVSEFTLDDRTLNIFTFIGLVGWVPTVVFLIVLALFVRNFRQYTVMADSVLTLTKDVDTMGPALEAGRVKVTTGAVWLPPEPRDYERHRHQQQRGRANGGGGIEDSDDDDEYEDPSTQHQLEDPSMYFLRGNRSFTLLALRVPMLMVELYSAIFFIGMIGDVTATFGPRLVYVIPAALLPLIIVWLTIPIGAFMLACLSSMGSRLGEDDLAEAFLSSGEWRELLGDEVAIDEHGVDPNEYGKDPNANDNNACVYCEERIGEIRDLEEKIESLERLCKKFGLKTKEYRGNARHSHHQEIPVFDTNFSPSNKNTKFNWPSSNNSQPDSDDMLLPNNNNNNNRDDGEDSDLIEMADTNQNQNNLYSPTSGITSSYSNFLAPDNVQAASFQDRKQKELAKSFNREKQNQKNNQYFQQQQQQQQENLRRNSNASSSNLNFNNNNNNMNNNNNPHQNRYFASSSQQQQNSSHASTPRIGGNNNNSFQQSIPLLSTSALASPRMNNVTSNSTRQTTPRAGGNSSNVFSPSNTSSSHHQQHRGGVPSSSYQQQLQQHQHGNAMMKNIGSALRGM